MKRRHTHASKDFNPETLALGYGYEPTLSEGAVKPPVFLTSTFQFQSAEEGKAFFQLAYGLREPNEGEQSGLIYSRLNNPNLQIFEERLAAWDLNEVGATFASGMAAISSTAFGLLRPGEVVIATSPIYGGSHYLLEKILPRFGIECRFVDAGDDAAARIAEAAEALGPERVRLVFIETPANPSNMLTDIRAVADVCEALTAAHDRKVYLAVDNTFLGPIFQRPALFGADLVIYSATKFIGGHSDVVAGVVTGSKAAMMPIMEARTILGTMANPFAGWLLLRSLETVSVRMRRQAKTAKALAKMLQEHPKVTRVNYPTLLPEGCPQRALYERQCTGPGSLISFEVEGGEAAAFKVLNSFQICRLAVSLGGTESLVEHPMRMTHADIEPEILITRGVTPGLIRMSVGLEHLSDLKQDLKHALKQIS
ncbi:aminotransferase class I/II-fold pyridoxal phosphate-dependent enzyme [Myxococcota bacterium]|nr:aminotransferase class I/II-fold pyridoxal phosphate-dependent enzyme [Myxococcota bacterium]MBU1431953.1 aminotransferase class I/II-fold pyridoxal phosphate-dependent enzyme [Myxococcota bacterium]MBU1898815.1 aminotransferase class I/II-fold pyridoxal phosphate-dependent enzyme [Myxococcota bacterium]